MRLTALRQQGSAKAILPRVGDVPEVVFLNTSGGLTGGDRLDLSLDLDGQAVATTQTAERAYDAGGGTATVRVHHRVTSGWLDWLPQETILYDRARVDRITRIDLGADAGCMMLEMLVLGRAAMGEVVRDLHFSDRREIWRCGKPVLLEWLLLDNEALRAGPAGLGGSRAIATLAIVGQGAEGLLERARGALGQDGVEAAASAFDGKLVVRMRAGDGWPLRLQVARLLRALRDAPLPRVWQI